MNINWPQIINQNLNIAENIQESVNDMWRLKFDKL
jgi:hypothetical protein